jgi:homoserine kinase
VGADLPLETENVAGVAGLALLDAVETDFGFDIEIYKNIKAGSGIGSVPVQQELWNQCLMGTPFETKDLVQFAMQGEKLACGNAHADNVALPFWVDLL